MRTGDSLGLRTGNEAVQAEAGSPTVSIVVPVYNGAQFLAQSIDSILAQTHRPFEIIVMDDCSTDETPKIVASYGDSVRSVRQSATRGIYGNANDGIALATGQLIGVFHADDVYLPEMLEREVDWLEEHPRAGVVFCSDVFIDAEGRRLGTLELPPNVRGSRALDYPAVLNSLLMYTNVFLRTPTALVRASIYRELGGYRDEELKNTAELDMWLRISKRYEMGTLEDHLILRRRHDASSARRYHRARTEPFRFFTIMDRELEEAGHAVATADALRAYEAHRAVDNVLRSANHYMLGDRKAARAVLRDVRLRDLAGSSKIQRGRMVLLGVGLKVLARLPRIAVVGRLFERHWYGGASPRSSA